MRARLALAALTALTLAALAAPAAAQAGNARVVVVHGLPGVFADVYVNGQLSIDNFDPAEVTDPIELAAGTYTIDLRAADAAATDPVLLSAQAQVPAGANITLVAHLNGQAQPTLTPFVNDVSQIPAGQARLTMRHTAAAPAVDILADGQPAFRNVTNGQQATTTLAADTISASVALAGTTQAVLGPANVELDEGVHTIAYAVGNANDNTLDLILQTIDGLESAPGGVPSGTGGDAAPGLPWVALAAMVAAGLVGITAARRLAVLRARR
jgi:hypothetical protein